MMIQTIDCFCILMLYISKFVIIVEVVFDLYALKICVILQMFNLFFIYVYLEKLTKSPICLIIHKTTKIKQACTWQTHTVTIILIESSWILIIQMTPWSRYHL